MHKKTTTAIILIALITLFYAKPSVLSQETIGEKDTNPPAEETGREDINESNIKLGDIVVTATRTEINKREVGTSLTVITEEEIKKSGKTTLTDILLDVPGVTVNRNSVFGGQASVYIRGSDTGNILVMIDGVEVNDPSHMNRAFDFSNLMLENIERIEILRGPQSTLYGSDATGGVINIITKRGKGDPTVNLVFEAGSYMTFREGLNISGSTEKTYYSFSASHLSTEGISKASETISPEEEPEDDGYKNMTVSSRLGINVLKDSSLDFNFRYIDTEADLDDSSIDDPNYKSYTKFLSSGAKFIQPVFKWWEHNISLSYINQLRRYRDKTDEFDSSFYNQWFEGNNKKAMWQHNFNIESLDNLTCGFEIEEEKGSYLNYDDYGSGPMAANLDEQKVQTLSYYVQNHLKLLDSIFITIGGRIDDHKEFGTHTSYMASGAFVVPVIDTRITCNYGTGFKAPSIYQLYDMMYGNKDLEPEESKSFDAGFDQELLDGMIFISAAYFNNSYENMLNFGSATYENIGEVEMNGLEGEISIRPVEYLTLRYIHTFQKTEDKETGKELDKRPENQGTLIINLFLLGKLNININSTYRGERKDKAYDPITYSSTEKTLDSYFRFDLFASYDLTENFQVFGKAENIADKEYQESYGYKMPGRSFYGGIKASF